MKTAYVIIGVLVLALIGTAAFASGNSNNSGDANASATASHNGNTTATTGPISNTNTANGGAGGSASATGGSVKNYNDIRSTNIQGQQQGQVQGQKQGQAQGQTQSATVGNSGNNTGTASNSTTLTFNEERQAVAAFAPAMNTTASCRVGVGVGVGAAVGGVSIGGAYKDEDCDAREKGRMLIESARIAHSMGAPSEYTAPLFMEGLALIRGATAKKSEPTVAAPAAFESYTQ